MSRASRAHQRLAVRYFDDRILLTDTSAWAYFRLPTVSYEFVTPDEREALATNITIALAAIRMPDAEVHLRVAHRTYPAAEWAMALNATSDEGPGWRDYLEEMYRHVWAKDFCSKEVYLGVRLGPRGKQLGAGALAQIFGLYQKTEKALGMEDDHVPDSEIGRWTESAERLGRALASSALYARHATSVEVAWLFQHAAAGALGDPPPSASPKRRWGRGEIESLVEGEIHNGRSLLRIVQPQGDSYVSYLSFARFPDLMPFPDGEPWMHFADQLPFPVEISSRMRLIPPVKASKDVARKLAHARDMDHHIREAGAEAPLALAEQIDAARLLEHGITKERLPFVYGWHRLIVAAPTEDICVQRVEAVVEHYRDMGIDVVNSTGDQFSLFCESLPGEKVRVNAYAQRQPLRTIAGGMATATVDLGDRLDDGGNEGWLGPYIGETVGRARSIVHFDPLVAATRNRPTAIAITGEPGGGKTTLALLMIYQMALRGVTVAVIDPKGDAESLVRLLEKRGRKARVIPLGSAAPGLLDPFSFGDDIAAKKTMATETLRLLLPRMSEERESAMIQAVAAVSNGPDPSLGKVVDFLEQADDPASKNLGAVLRSMSEMHLARLCFDPSGGDQIDSEGWTTVFTLGGLTLPDVATTRDDYSYEQRLSVALLYLVSQFARRLMNGLDRRAPKAIFLDEAWAITSTPEGAKLVPEVSRMGRSRNTALVLVSQNAGDLLNEQVTNCLSSVFAFRSTERVEVEHVMSLLGVEPSEEHKAVLRSLGNGECIFRDLDGRAGRIGVDLISEELLRWLDTNPTHDKPDGDGHDDHQGGVGRAQEVRS
ncbi:ATP-binding protein [Nonomuraea sp. NPDC050786]|uniref:ATP-binding protein n=1 Tax=Nonomuraea sp. NPDC050786 TaxID=3154840 RepID=UPI00340A811B